ncbi:MAG: hypothetical protein H8D82_00090, partial [Euryarchaeota archaeon]|nr:hypothetical protein [Euryarchaeota archaeon]
MTEDNSSPSLDAQDEQPIQITHPSDSDEAGNLESISNLDSDINEVVENVESEP